MQSSHLPKLLLSRSSRERLLLYDVHELGDDAPQQGPGNLTSPIHYTDLHHSYTTEGAIPSNGVQAREEKSA